jgi:hypothetical protein
VGRVTERTYSTLILGAAIGDDCYIWIALEDEDGGRVRISPINTGLNFPPNQIVETKMIYKAEKVTYPRSLIYS